uniref:Ubiquitin-like protease family profile domain-containing protein n=1 Tax=Rhodosorus marinus TaxID=101924 RepID=A0A7S2ZEF4_9RHOD|mmetsp:Transcript_16604/g.68076  ORF Transcript_16604/g.68076 Transcript_16604/m.68076 type:complete len:357 (+) Transcript_16604:267-1337(+)
MSGDHSTSGAGSEEVRPQSRRKRKRLNDGIVDVDKYENGGGKMSKDVDNTSVEYVKDDLIELDEEKTGERGEDVVIDLIEDVLVEGKDIGPDGPVADGEVASEDSRVLFEFPPSKKGSIKLTTADRDRLAPEKYLNDSIIDFYIKFIEMFETPPRLRDQCYFFNSFFFNLLFTSPKVIHHKNVKRWTQEVDLFTKKYIFVPICRNSHWTLIVICNCGKLPGWERDHDNPEDRPVMLIYDSLRTSSVASSYAVALKAYLAEEYQSKFAGKPDFTAPDFSKMTAWIPRVPSQSNEFDCGLYILQYIIAFLQDTPEELQEKKDVNRPDVQRKICMQARFCHLQIALGGPEHRMNPYSGA